jgi:hypothetical protein
MLKKTFKKLCNKKLIQASTVMKMNMKIISRKIQLSLYDLCAIFFSAPLPSYTKFTMIWCPPNNKVTSIIIVHDLCTMLFIKCCNRNHWSNRTKHSLLMKSRRSKNEILLSRIILKIKRQHYKLSRKYSTVTSSTEPF